MVLPVARITLIILIGIIVSAVIYPTPFIFGVAKIVTKLQASWRRHLVRKYGTLLANEYHLTASKQMKKEGFSQAECHYVFGKRFDETVEKLGIKFAHEHFGPPTGLSRLLGEAV